MPKLTSVAVDTNFLINYAAKDETILDCLGTINKRLPNPKIIVLPTVILELNDISESDDNEGKDYAREALEKMLDPWKFQPVNCVPVGHGIVEQIGCKLRNKGILPEWEVHDGFIVAEAALYGATLLISSDRHIKDINQQMLKLELKDCDVECPLIASPWKIVNQFFPK